MIRKGSLFVNLMGILLAGILLSGCGLKFTIKEPVVSTIQYAAKDAKPVTLRIVDARSGSDAAFIVGKIGLGTRMRDISNILVFENIKDPIGYLAMQMEREFNGRGIPVKCVVAQSAAGGLTLKINRYQVINYRATGFSPWEACHVFFGIIDDNGKQTPIRAYFYNGKTPVWSMNEILEPCFNVPTSIIIKEVVSKINKAVFAYKVPDAAVNMLTSDINADFEKNNTAETFWKVLELGYTNNPVAMEPLMQFSQKGDDEFFKSCALTAIGTLGPENQFEFLKERFKAGGFNDRYMATKAIGDIGTPEALQFVRDQKNTDAYQGEGGLKSCVDLYAP